MLYENVALIFSIAIFGYLKRKGCWQRQKLTNGRFYLRSLLENKPAKCLILDFFVFTRCYGGGAFVLDKNWVALADSEASALTRIAVFKAVAKTFCQCWFSLTELALEWRWTLSSFALLNPPQNLLCVLLNSPARFKNTTSLMSALKDGQCVFFSMLWFVGFGHPHLCPWLLQKLVLVYRVIWFLICIDRQLFCTLRWVLNCFEEAL